MSRFSPRPTSALALLALLAPSLHAHINVHLDIPRFMFVDYEPTAAATVTITNMTGRDLHSLKDQAPEKWFSF